MVRIAPPAIGARSILAFIFLARVIMLLLPNPPSRSPLKLLPLLFSMVILYWFLAEFLAKTTKVLQPVRTIAL